METINNVMDEVQKDMATRYDAEFNKIRYYVDTAYELGLEDGALKAKAEIINLINGGK